MYKMLRILYVSLWILPAVARNSNISYFNVQQSPEDNDVSSCVKDIIDSILKPDDFITDVILLHIDDEVEIHKLHEINKARFITTSFSCTESKVYKRIYIMSATDFDEFKNGMNHTMKDVYFNPFANFIIVLENFYQRRAMAKFLVFNNIYNVTILTREDVKAGYGIYSLQSPITPCNQSQRIVKVTDCSNYKRGTHIFPEMEALRGCNFSLMTHNNFPLINLDNPNEEGIEQKIMRHFAKYSGIGIQFLTYSRMNKFGDVDSNFSYTYLLEKVLMSEIDGAVGGYVISNDDTEKLFSLSYPLTTDSLVVIVPRSNDLDAWHTFFNRKTLFPAILVFTVIIVFSISAYLFSLFPTQRVDPVRDILIIFGYFLNKFIASKFKSGIPETIIISSLLFAIIIIPYTIQAFLWSIKTHPMRGWEAKDYDEVIQAHQLIVPLELKGAEIFTKEKKCLNPLQCLKIVRDQKDKLYYTILTGSIYESYKWMVADERCNLRLYKLKEPMSTVLRTIYFKRGSVLKIPFDKFYFRLQAAGLVQQIYGDIIFREKMKCKPQQFVSRVAPLQLRDFNIPYNVLIGGYCVSAAVFACEVLTHKK